MNYIWIEILLIIDLFSFYTPCRVSFLALFQNIFGVTEIATFNHNLQYIAQRCYVSIFELAVWSKTLGLAYRF